MYKFNTCNWDKYWQLEIYFVTVDDEIWGKSTKLSFKTFEKADKAGQKACKEGLMIEYGKSFTYVAFVPPHQIATYTIQELPDQKKL